MSDSKFCKNCAFHSRPGNVAICSHPTSVRPERLNLVTGEVHPAGARACDNVRDREYEPYCGPAAIHFERKMTIRELMKSAIKL